MKDQAGEGALSAASRVTVKRAVGASGVYQQSKVAAVERRLSSTGGARSPCVKCRPDGPVCGGCWEYRQRPLPATRVKKGILRMAAKLKSLDDVIGQKNIVRWFRATLSRDGLPPVIMLSGPAGIGKTSIAKIVACEVACMNSPEKLESTKHTVIDEDKSTDSVRVYNMSNLKSQDAVNDVKSDLSVGFSSTGRKVVIMDEAHGMSEEAQDSLLTTFESLQAHVYVIVCTTDTSSFRDAFLSRCVPRKLTSLSASEMRTFLKKRIEENGLKFEISMPMAVQLISTYTGREPRRAINMLDSFEKGQVVTVAELETFFNVYEGKQIITLLDYLYAGDILRGIEFVSDMDTGSTFQSTLLDIVRVAQDGQSQLLNGDAVLHVRNLIMQNGFQRLLGFAIDCTTQQRLTRNMVCGYFLKWCSQADKLFSPPEKIYAEQVHTQDLQQMQGMLEQRTEVYTKGDSEVAISLEALLSQGETIV